MLNDCFWDGKRFAGTHSFVLASVLQEDTPCAVKGSRSLRSCVNIPVLWVRGERESSAAALLKLDTKWRRPWDGLDVFLVVFFI